MSEFMQWYLLVTVGINFVGILATMFVPGSWEVDPPAYGLLLWLVPFAVPVFILWKATPVWRPRLSEHIRLAGLANKRVDGKRHAFDTDKRFEVGQDKARALDINKAVVCFYDPADRLRFIYPDGKRF